MQPINQQKSRDKPLSVSEYIALLNEGLRGFRATIIGETFKVSPSAKGHVYFSLKDKDGSVLHCVIWKTNYKILGIELKDGMEIIASGYPDVYPLKGELTFKAKTIELVGEGALRQAYEKLKKKLAKEGLFGVERKRLIPEYPQKIGVITSLTSGVVIHDFESNLGKFGFHIKAIDSRVEGQEAVKDLLLSLDAFRKESIDVLVIMRGGGSMQALMAFDNETLVREVADFPVPVIAAIGHHVDVPLIALVADKEVSTPSVAAFLLNRSWEQTTEKLQNYENKILSAYSSAVSDRKLGLKDDIQSISEGLARVLGLYKEVESSLKVGVLKLNSALTMKRKSINDAGRAVIVEFSQALMQDRNYIRDSWVGSLLPSFSRSVGKVWERLGRASAVINANDPRRQLKLGYSIAYLRGKVVRSIQDVNIGSVLNLHVSDGEIGSEVKDVKGKTDG